MAVGASWWLSGKESACQCRRREFDPLGREDPLEKQMAPTPVFLTKKSNKERSLVDPQGRKRDGHDLATEQQHNRSTCHVGQTSRGAPDHSS